MRPAVGLQVLAPNSHPSPELVFFWLFKANNSGTRNADQTSPLNWAGSSIISICGQVDVRPAVCWRNLALKELLRPNLLLFWMFKVKNLRNKWTWKQQPVRRPWPSMGYCDPNYCSHCLKQSSRGLDLLHRSPLNWLDDCSPLSADKWTWRQQSVCRLWPSMRSCYRII